MNTDSAERGQTTALVIGGRGYLGTYICNTLADAGVQVVAADLPQASKAAKAAAVNTASEKHMQLDIDVTDEASVDRLFEAIGGPVDILIYAATSKPHDFYKPLTACSLEGWKSVLDVELNGLFLLVRKAGKLMEENGGGVMVLLSSIYGVVGNDQRLYQGSNLHELYGDGDIDQQSQPYSHPVYAAAKGAVIALARYLAAYWQGQNIRVNAISPGGIFHPGENEAFLKKYGDKVPLGRKAQPQEVADAVVFLALDESGYVNGHNLVVDGGFTIW